MAFTYVNGQFMETSAAVIPVTDRGFLFGDGVFETLRVHGSVPYRWGWHMDRLQRGLNALSITPPTNDLRAACENLLEKNAVDEGMLRIAVTRGSGSAGYLPLPGNAPSLVIETRPLPPYPKSIRLWRSSVEKISLRALPTGNKLAAQGLNATLARLEAQEHACDEALQLSAEGHVSEAASANLFWIKAGTLYTPALECGCLEGSIRARLLELYNVQEGRYAPEALKEADAVFLTNTAYLTAPAATLSPMGWEWPASERMTDIAAHLSQDISEYCSTRAWS